MKTMNTNIENFFDINDELDPPPKEKPAELSRSQIAAKVAAKNGITKTKALAIVEQIAELTHITIPDDADLARQALIKKLEKKLKAKLERTFDAACKVGVRAARAGKFPIDPVILFGKKGYYFGDLYNSRGVSVCDNLREEFYGFDSDTDVNGMMPEWGEVYDWTMENLFFSGDGWVEALKKALKTGDYSVLLR